MFPESDFSRDDQYDSPLRGSADGSPSVPPVLAPRRSISSMLPPPNDPRVRLESAEKDLKMAESIVEKRKELNPDPDLHLTQRWIQRLSALRVHVAALRHQMAESQPDFEKRVLDRMRQRKKVELQEVLFVAGDL